MTPTGVRSAEKAGFATTTGKPEDRRAISATLSNTAQKMFRWRKLGRVFDPREVDIDWMKDFAQAPSTLVLDDRVRVYFACRPAADRNGQFVSYMAYVDFKRGNLHERVDISKEWILPLGERGTFDEFGTNSVGVERRTFGFTRGLDEVRIRAFQCASAWRSARQ
jgi:hypothetical protein